ncbi:MAG TPA: hypothetical protein VME19_16500 [Streptosporangiaceae bacterium]|nr:hypothetical protein [Streptosporangiaceae bacterium]
MDDRGRHATGPGSGPQQALGRTPVRGFPPVSGQSAEAFGLSHDAWAGPAGPAGQNGDSVAYFDYSEYTEYTEYTAGDEADTQDGYDDPPLPAPVARVAAGRRRSARARRRFPSRGALLGMVAVVVVGAGFAGYKYLYESRANAPVSPTLKLPTTVPSDPDYDKALGKWQHIGTRAEDRSPATIDELFPAQFELNGGSFVRAAASVTTTCSLAVYGAKLQAALQAGDCSQVLRASYVSGTMMGTIGVINLTSASAASKAGKVTGPEEIIAPLSSRKGVTSKLGTGTGVVQAEIKGHYLILMWAEFTDLKKPSTSAQRQMLEQFASNLVTGSANINLSTRMLTGKA